MTVLSINDKPAKALERHKVNPIYCTNKQQVFIIGSKGIPANYGGFETFVEKLTEYQKSDRIRYHVARMANDGIRYEYNGAKCFDIKVPGIGSAKAVYYDIVAFCRCIHYCANRPAIQRPIFLILACRIGPFMGYFKRKVNKIGGAIYVNPDGHEWMRRKWNMLIREYWKFSEKLMVKHADLLICDSKNIEKYIHTEYRRYNPKTVYIAYGSETKPSILSDNDVKLMQWYAKNKLIAKQYYLIVGRFVPENNFDVIIREFMNSNTSKSLAIVTTENHKLQIELDEKFHFSEDPRIKFVGTVYDQELLKKIRENAYGYLHGHEVGGTNPSLLEALSSTNLNLLLDVGFNREVAENCALYWNKGKGNLARLIEIADRMSSDEAQKLGVNANKRITNGYSWNNVVNLYEKIFRDENWNQ